MTLFESRARYSLYNGERIVFSLRGTSNYRSVGPLLALTEFKPLSIVKRIKGT